MTKLGTIVRTTERLGGINSRNEVCMIEAGELSRVEAVDDKPDTFILVPVKRDGEHGEYRYDETSDWCEAYHVIPRQWEEVTP